MTVTNFFRMVSSDELHEDHDLTSSEEGLLEGFFHRAFEHRVHCLIDRRNGGATSVLASVLSKQTDMSLYSEKASFSKSFYVFVVHVQGPLEMRRSSSCSIMRALKEYADHSCTVLRSTYKFL